MAKIRILGGYNITDLVADPKWQSLREGFVGTWKGNEAANIKTLRAYLGPVVLDKNVTSSATLSEGNRKKVLRVLNYLTGTAFRSGTVSHPEIEKLLKRLRALNT